MSLGYSLFRMRHRFGAFCEESLRIQKASHSGSSFLLVMRTENPTLELDRLPWAHARVEPRDSP
ncbi:hypothetical protein M408DRAFT_327861, partial [Serendipita vermifera MAFF 305830]